MLNEIEVELSPGNGDVSTRSMPPREPQSPVPWNRWAPHEADEKAQRRHPSPPRYQVADAYEEAEAEARREPSPSLPSVRSQTLPARSAEGSLERGPSAAPSPPSRLIELRFKLEENWRRLSTLTGGGASPPSSVARPEPERPWPSPPQPSALSPSPSPQKRPNEEQRALAAAPDSEAEDHTPSPQKRPPVPTTPRAAATAPVGVADHIGMTPTDRAPPTVESIVVSPSPKQPEAPDSAVASASYITSEKEATGAECLYDSTAATVPLLRPFRSARSSRALAVTTSPSAGMIALPPDPQHHSPPLSPAPQPQRQLQSSAAASSDVSFQADLTSTILMAALDQGGGDRDRECAQGFSPASGPLVQYWCRTCSCERRLLLLSPDGKHLPVRESFRFCPWCGTRQD